MDAIFGGLDEEDELERVFRQSTATSDQTTATAATPAQAKLNAPTQVCVPLAG